MGLTENGILECKIGTLEAINIDHTYKVRGCTLKMLKGTEKNWEMLNESPQHCGVGRKVDLPSQRPAWDDKEEYHLSFGHWETIS